MRKLLVIGIVLGAAAIGIAEEDVSARIDKLILRWTLGDAASRAGVAAETHALGDRAIAELYQRLARSTFDFVGPEMGATFSRAERLPNTKRMIMAEVEFVEPKKGAELPQRPTLLDPEQAARLMRAGQTVAAPKLTVYDGQRANASINNRHAYTRTIDSRRRTVKGSVQTGLMVEMRPQLVEGTRSISIELRCIRAKLDGGSVPTLSTTAGEVGMPFVTKREFALTLTVESGEWITLAFPGDKPVILRIRTTRLQGQAKTR